MDHSYSFATITVTHGHTNIGTSSIGFRDPVFTPRSELFCRVHDSGTRFRLGILEQQRVLRFLLCVAGVHRGIQLKFLLEEFRES
jgi:hypothetical protein